MNDYWWESKAFWSMWFRIRHRNSIDCHRLCWSQFNRHLSISRLFSLSSTKKIKFIVSFSLKSHRFTDKWDFQVENFSIFFFIFLFYRKASASIVVWVLIIVESARLGQKVDRDIFRWPIWLAVGSTGAYFISFLLILVSACRTARHRRIIKNHYYQHGEHF